MPIVCSVFLVCFCSCQTISVTILQRRKSTCKHMHIEQVKVSQSFVFRKARDKFNLHSYKIDFNFKSYSIFSVFFLYSSSIESKSYTVKAQKKKQKTEWL